MQLRWMRRRSGALRLLAGGGGNFTLAPFTPYPHPANQGPFCTDFISRFDLVFSLRGPLLALVRPLHRQLCFPPPTVDDFLFSNCPNYTPCLHIAYTFNMSPVALEKEDHSRDADFNKAMHGKSAQAQGGMAAMLKKDRAAQQAAVDEYFKHWDNKAAADETEETRKVRCLDTHSRSRLLTCPRLAATSMPLSLATTTTSRPTCTSMAGARASTSAALPTASPSTRPLPATSTIWRSRWD